MNPVIGRGIIFVHHSPGCGVLERMVFGCVLTCLSSSLFLAALTSLQRGTLEGGAEKRESEKLLRAVDYLQTSSRFFLRISFVMRSGAQRQTFPSLMSRTEALRSVCVCFAFSWRPSADVCVSEEKHALVCVCVCLQ